VSCLIEIWTMVGEQQTLYTPACLNCGWIGSDGTMPEAEAEGAMHERGERRPWQLDAVDEAVRRAAPRG
jgi:hypothetical protein